MNQNGSASKWTRILDLLSEMFLNPEKRLQYVAEIASLIMGCLRCCIVLKKSSHKKTGYDLTIAAGYPQGDHGIGLDLRPETGGLELQKIIKEGNIVYISDSLKSEKVKYMLPMIEHFRIKKQLFIPLYFKKRGSGYDIEPFGIMIFDAVETDNQEVFARAASHANKIAKLVVAVILNDQQKLIKSDELEKIIRIRTLGEQSRGFEDIIRNTNTILKPFLKRLQGTLNDLQKEIGEETREKKEKFKQADFCTETLGHALDQFTRKAEEAMATTRFCASNLIIGEHNLPDFLKNLTDQYIAEKKQSQVSISVNLDLRKIAKNATARFDYERLKHCFRILMENALEAGAKEIFIQVLIRSVSPVSKQIKIVLENDGLPINPLIKDQIFLLFSSANSNKSGSGLSIVSSIIKAHNGKIFLQEFQKKIREKEPKNSHGKKSGKNHKEKPDNTRFVIHLPLV